MKKIIFVVSFTLTNLLLFLVLPYNNIHDGPVFTINTM